ncbi:MAG: hypothetical protein ACI9Q9_001164, partial [Flavobacterium sp.]
DLPITTINTSVASVVFTNKDYKPFNKLNIHKTILSLLNTISIFLETKHKK